VQPHFAVVTFILTVTLKPGRDIDILVMYLYTNNEAAKLSIQTVKR